jgi:hypothetical protein
LIDITSWYKSLCTHVHRSAFGVLPLEKSKKLLQVHGVLPFRNRDLVHYHSEIGFWCTTIQKSAFGALPLEKLTKLLQVQRYTTLLWSGSAPILEW